MAREIRRARCMMVKAVMPERLFNLVVPLPHEGTDMRTTDTAAHVRAWSGAVSSPLKPLGQRSDAQSTNRRSTPVTTTMPGIRTSTTATRTTTTSRQSCVSAPSADQSHPPHADLLLELLVIAYRDCRRSKRNKSSQLVFEADLERNLCRLRDELRAGIYQPGPSICFVITRPKPREVWAAAFRDRVVHHLSPNLTISAAQRWIGWCGVLHH
jgi:hypothetical protein